MSGFDNPSIEYNFLRLWSWPGILLVEARQWGACVYILSLQMYYIHKWWNKGNLDKNEVLKAISRDKQWCADKTNGVWTTYSLSCCSVGNMPSTRVDRQQINKLSGSAKYRTLKWLILSMWEAWVRVHVYQKVASNNRDLVPSFNWRRGLGWNTGNLGRLRLPDSGKTHKI